MLVRASLLRRPGSVHIERVDAPKPASPPSNSPTLPHPVRSGPQYTAPRLAHSHVPPADTAGRTGPRGAHPAPSRCCGKPDARPASARRQGACSCCRQRHGDTDFFAARPTASSARGFESPYTVPGIFPV